MMIFLDSIFKLLWRDDSGSLQGSLCQLRNVTDRKGQKNSKKRDNKHWNEEDRFFNTVFSCFVTAHALDFFGMSDEKSIPTKCGPDKYPTDAEWTRADDGWRQGWLSRTMQDFVRTFFLLDSQHFDDDAEVDEEVVVVTRYSCGAKLGRNECKEHFKHHDKKPIENHRARCPLGGRVNGQPLPDGFKQPVQVRKKKLVVREEVAAIPAALRYKYAVLNLGFAYEGMRDVIREGDGNRQDVYFKLFYVVIFIFPLFVCRSLR